MSRQQWSCFGIVDLSLNSPTFLVGYPISLFRVRRDLVFLALSGPSPLFYNRSMPDNSSFVYPLSEVSLNGWKKHQTPKVRTARGRGVLGRSVWTSKACYS